LFELKDYIKNVQNEIQNSKKKNHIKLILIMCFISIVERTAFVAATTGAYTVQAADVAAGNVTFYALVTPDVVGNYSFLVSTSAHTTASAAAAAYRAGDVNTSFSLTAGTNSVTAVTLTPLVGSDILAGSPNGVPVQVSLTGGTLSGVEGINLTATGGGRIAPASGAVPGSFAAAGATTALTAESWTFSGIKETSP
jgi:hypothetical protein